MGSEFFTTFTIETKTNYIMEFIGDSRVKTIVNVLLSGNQKEIVVDGIMVDLKHYLKKLKPFKGVVKRAEDEAEKIAKEIIDLIQA